MGNAPAYLAGAALIVGVAGYGAARFLRWLARQWFLRVAWHWLSGWRSDGRPGRGRRAAWHSGAVAAAVVLLACWAAAPVLTSRFVVFAGFLSFAAGVWQAWRQVHQLKHRRVWLRPAHLAACEAAQIDPRREPWSWLSAAPDYSWVKAELDAGWSGDSKDEQRLAAILTAKFGMENAEAAWHRAGPKPALTLTESKPPPRAVSLADIRNAILAAAADAIVVGLGRLGVPILIDLDGDSPHIGLSMGSGGGKSVTSRLILAQLLSKGCFGVVLDVKRISHTWAKGLPNTIYVRDIEDIHDALLALAAEGDHRNRVADKHADIEGRVHADVGPRIVVIAEELNTLMKRLRAYWLRERVSGDPVRSPALDALDEVLCMGRQVRINVVMIGQRLSDKATGGGGDARENLAALVLARFKPSTWKMLVPDIAMPPRTTHKLRGEVVTDVARTVQIALLTGREGRDLATSGIVAECPAELAGLPGAPRLPVTSYGQQAIGGPEQGFVTSQPGIPPVPRPPVMDLVTVREAIREGILPPGTTPEAVKQARWRDSQRPEGERVFPERKGTRRLAPVYDRAELEDWGAARR